MAVLTWARLLGHAGGPATYFPTNTGGHPRFSHLGWAFGGEFAMYYFFATVVNVRRLPPPPHPARFGRTRPGVCCQWRR